ncbi:MAG: hypothetical protein NT108_02165 [Candidatus Kaiserbacteria bacterium]|nr:hypothetical protein [Candidatus Kaiserbacteria bacterium]
MALSIASFLVEANNDFFMGFPFLSCLIERTIGIETIPPKLSNELKTLVGAEAGCFGFEVFSWFFRLLFLLFSCDYSGYGFMSEVFANAKFQRTWLADHGGLVIRELAGFFHPVSNFFLSAGPALVKFRGTHCCIDTGVAAHERHLQSKDFPDSHWILTRRHYYFPAHSLQSHVDPKYS